MDGASTHSDVEVAVGVLVDERDIEVVQRGVQKDPLAGFCREDGTHPARAKWTRRKDGRGGEGLVGTGGEGVA